LPTSVKPRKLSASRTTKTLAGIFAAADTATLRGIRLPAFDKNRGIEEQKPLVFGSTCRYVIILSTDFLSKVGINIIYETGFIEWYECILPLRDPFSLDTKYFNDIEDIMVVQTENELLGDNCLDSFATEMLDAKYNNTYVKDIVKQQTIYLLINRKTF